jgi:hypothetical protein
MCIKYLPLSDSEHALILEILNLNMYFKPEITKTEDMLIFEYTLLDEEIDVTVDKIVTEKIEDSLDWVWYTQGTDLETKRRDVIFKRVWLTASHEQVEN